MGEAVLETAEIDRWAASRLHQVVLMLIARGLHNCVRRTVVPLIRLWWRHGGDNKQRSASKLERITTKKLIFFEKLERATRIERATLTLARLCSTPELRPLPLACPGSCRAGGGLIAYLAGKCKNNINPNPT